MDENKKNGPEYVEPKVAVEHFDKETARKNSNGNGTDADRAAREAALLGSTSQVIALKRAELKSELSLRKVELKEKIDTIKARETAKERAGKHLAVFGAAYLCILVLAFLVSVQYIDGENLAIVATLITLVVTSLSGILKGISDTPEEKSPTELMHDIVQKQLTIQDHHDSKQK